MGVMAEGQSGSRVAGNDLADDVPSDCLECIVHGFLQAALAHGPTGLGCMQATERRPEEKPPRGRSAGGPPMGGVRCRGADLRAWMNRGGGARRGRVYG